MAVKLIPRALTGQITREA